MINAVIIDDEMKSAELLHLKLARFCPHVQVLSIFTNAAVGISFVAEKKPAVVFLDIEMPEINGLMAAKQLNSLTEIIFVTAYEKYSIEALRLTAFDYLLKPIDETDLKTAISRLEEKLALKNKSDNKKNANQQFDKIAVPTLDGIHFLNIRDIVKVEAESNYAIFYLQDKKKMTVSKTLKQVEEALQPYTFFRPHKSHIINIQFISRYIRGEGGSIIMIDGSEVELSRTKKKEFLELFEGL
jgi:two-component system, LytTR family, response regulator